VILHGTRAEVEERALPFREGDEVLVQIVEPHMYDDDDAVAKIDGYIIAVSRGGPHVGSKRLVRIDEVGRTAATATLVGDPEPPAAADGNGAVDDDDVQSRPRRRGRRGGRRRSRAKAGTAGGSEGANE